MRWNVIYDMADYGLALLLLPQTLKLPFIFSRIGQVFAISTRSQPKVAYYQPLLSFFGIVTSELVNT